MNELHIAPDKPLIFTSGQQFIDTVKAVLWQLGAVTDNTVTKHDQEEVTRVSAQKILKEKGYQVTSEAAFIKLVKDQKLTKIKRGREYWYKVEELNKIPCRK